MLIPLVIACSCCWSLIDFKNEVDTQVYKISEEIKETHEENLYSLGYLYGKLDVYKSFQESLEDEKPD